jgi:hypothetical protein
VALTLVFFLVRPWLTETNVVLLLAPALVLAALHRLDRRLVTALWVVPLASTALYLWPLKLFWGIAPGVVAQGGSWAERHGQAIVAVRVVLIAVWQVAGWWTVAACLRPRSAATGVPLAEVRPPARAPTSEAPS